MRFLLKEEVDWHWVNGRSISEGVIVVDGVARISHCAYCKFCAGLKCTRLNRAITDLYPPFPNFCPLPSEKPEYET